MSKIVSTCLKYGKKTIHTFIRLSPPQAGRLSKGGAERNFEQISFNRMFISIIICMVLLLTMCNSQQPVAITDRLQGNVVGKICNEKGNPVANASVLIVPEGYVPLENLQNTVSVDSTTSNAAGYFSFNIGSSGKYNLLANDETLYALRKSIPVNAQLQMELPDETLYPPGSISGTVHQESMGDNRLAVVLVTGTNIYVSPETSTGEFRLSELAQGIYDLRIVTMASGFSMAETTVTVKSGMETKLPLITLSNKRVPQITTFAVDYNPLMMQAKLSWETSDNNLIDSFHIYCNREKDITPFLSTERNVNAITIDCMNLANDTFVFQIAPLGTDGWEGEPLSGDPFFNKSPISSEELAGPNELNSTRVTDLKLFHSNRFGIYYFKNSGGGINVYKMDHDLSVQKSVNIQCSMQFYSSIASDADGNIYFLPEPAKGSWDTVCIMKYDQDLNYISKNKVLHSKGSNWFSIAVSSEGTLILYGASFTPEKAWADIDTTRVTVFSSDYTVISETFYNDIREIRQSVDANDSITAVVVSNAWKNERLYYFDTKFNVLGTFDPLQNLNLQVPQDYKSVSILKICHPNIFLTAYTFPENHSNTLYFFNRNNEIIARCQFPDYLRATTSSYDVIFSGDNDYFYYIPRSPVKRYNIRAVIESITMQEIP
jgi:hypothetical protein